MGNAKSHEDVDETKLTPHSWCHRSGFPVWTNPTKMSIMVPILRKMVNGKIAIADNTHDCTDAEVAAFEHKKFNDSEESKKDYENFALHRPWSVQGFESKCPSVGESVDGKVFTLADAEERTLFSEVKSLGEEKESSAVAVMFGSITCPVWRSYGGQDLYKACRKKGLPVLTVYTLEAHASDEFPAPPNATGVMSLKRQVVRHQTIEERQTAALEAHAIVSRQVGEDIPMVLDNMDDSLENAYETRSFRIMVLDTATGAVKYLSGKGPYNIPAKMKDIAALQLA